MAQIEDFTTVQSNGHTSADKTRADERSHALGELLAAHRGECHVIILHDYPDPDAIAAAFAHRLISAQYNIETDILYTGAISHQQNIALVRLLGIDLVRYTNERDLTQYSGAIYVDNQGSAAA